MVITSQSAHREFNTPVVIVLVGNVFLARVDCKRYVPNGIGRDNSAVANYQMPQTLAKARPL
jgi:hypothetical protein